MVGILLCSLLASWTLAIELDLLSPASLKAAAKTSAAGMVSWYTGYMPGQVPGNLPPPYYWWEAGAMFMTLIGYWKATGDSAYNEITIQALLWQAGPDADFMPSNQTFALGNDDQAFWAFAAMEAAELNFPNPPDDQPQWLALAQAVFNTQVPRWDHETCGGGLRWQVFTFNKGFDYKNTISNGCFFHLASRLYRYTGNATYSQWAERAWDWSTSSGLISPDYHFYDGTSVGNNCTSFNRLQWSYNAGVYLCGAANMWNVTEDMIWKERIDGILTGLDIFFQDDVMVEIACEPYRTCNTDQRSFKAYLSRWMALTSQLAPWTSQFIMPKLAASAIAAAKQCNGGNDSKTCGLSWVAGSSFDGFVGVGEQMAATAVFTANLIRQIAAPVTYATGGNSTGNDQAGTDIGSSPFSSVYGQISTADRVGAGIFTCILLLFVVGGAIFILI